MTDDTVSPGCIISEIRFKSASEGLKVRVIKMTVHLRLTCFRLQFHFNTTLFVTQGLHYIFVE